MSDPSRDEDRRRRHLHHDEDDDHFNRLNRHIDATLNSMFNSLWTLPQALYQRGNEHGREFNRIRREQRDRDEEEHEQEREDARGSRACGWRGRRAVRDGEEMDRKGTIAWWQDGEDAWKRSEVPHRRHGEEGGEERGKVVPWFSRRGTEDHDRSERRATEDWAAVFPRWNAEGTARAALKDEDIDKPTEQNPPQPPELGDIIRHMNQAMSKMNADFSRAFNDAEHFHRAFKQSYKRDSELWEDEPFFPASVPFNRPLSTMFSLGLRSFMPTDSAMGYLLFSEYSPLQLENERGFDKSFRKRFEELVRLQGGKALEHDEGKIEGSRVEWIKRMVPLLEHSNGADEKKWEVYVDDTSPNKLAVTAQQHQPQIVRAAAPTAAEASPSTELDLYERFLTRDLPLFSTATAAPIQVAKSEPAQQTTQSGPQPRVISTITRESREPSSDGLTTIKTIKTKKYDDGTEERVEVEEMLPIKRPMETAARIDSKESMGSDSKIVEEARKGGGWFWSK